MLTFIRRFAGPVITFGIMGWAEVSGIWNLLLADSLLVFAALWGFVAFVTWHRIQIWEQKILRKFPYVIRILFTAVVIAVTAILINLGHSVAKDTDDESEIGNAYVIQTTTPDCREGQWPYALLIEFGVRQYEEKINIVINTGAEYRLVREWYGIPRKTDKSQHTPSGPGVTIGRIIGKDPEMQPPIYKHTIDWPSVTPNNSFYVYFESDQPMGVVSAVFAGRQFLPKGDRLVPVPDTQVPNKY